MGAVLANAHVEESLFTDVFGGSDGGRRNHHGLHVGQVDVASAVCVLAGVVVPQL